MNKILASFLCCLCGSCYALDGSVAFAGDINYAKSEESELLTRFGAENIVKLYEHPNKKWICYVKNKILFDYDHFGNELKTNVITTLGVDF
jgi:hypothetical protein